MHFQKIYENKKSYLNLLLIADEEECMIDRYIDRGEMFALYEDDLRALCVVTDESEGVFEIKNLVVVPQYQGKGYGKAMIDYISKEYCGRGHTLLVGTGESPLTVPFYEHIGFTYAYRVHGFFTKNYSHPIFGNGVQLVDMVYFKKSL